MHRHATTFERCAGCGAGLRHELLTFTAHVPEGSSPLCASCASRAVRRLVRTDRHVLADLEAQWRLSSVEEDRRG